MQKPARCLIIEVSMGRVFCLLQPRRGRTDILHSEMMTTQRTFTEKQKYKKVPANAFVLCTRDSTRQCVDLGKILEGRIFLTIGHLTEQPPAIIAREKAGSPDFGKSGTESRGSQLPCQESRCSGRAAAFLMPVIMTSIMQRLMSGTQLTRVQS